MTTVTRTQTQTETPTTVHVLRVVSAQGKLKCLLEEMKKAAQNGELVQYISEWEESYLSDYQPTSPLDVEKIEAAMALCFLLTNLEAVLPEFVDRLKEMIRETLPKTCDADRFIYVYKLKEAFFLLQELEDNLFANANRINEDCASRFEDLRSELHAINADRETNAIQLYRRLDVVNRNIKQVVLDLRRIHQGIRQEEQKMAAQENALNKSLDKCEDLLKKV